MGEWRYSSTHITSRLGHLITGETAPGTHWIGLWVGRSRSGYFREDNSCTCPESNHDMSIVQPAAQSLYRLSYPLLCTVSEWHPICVTPNDHKLTIDAASEQCRWPSLWKLNRITYYNTKDCFSVTSTVSVKTQTSKATMNELFHNLPPELHSSVYPYARSYESEIPRRLASPLCRQQMLATRATGVVIAHHPPWLVLQPLYKPRHPSFINDFSFCCSSMPIVRLKNRLSCKFW
jgi:hypothetical protein